MIEDDEDKVLVPDDYQPPDLTMPAEVISKGDLSELPVNESFEW